MNKKSFAIASLITVIALLLNFQLVLAHESVTVGDYEIEVGWVNEPAVAGQMNGIAVNVTNTSTSEPVEDVSSLSVTISYGGESKELSLEPRGEDTPGQFQAAILPTIPGQYTVMLGGQLGDTPVDAHVEPEEVGTADTIQFPSAPASTPQSANTGVAAWLTWLAVLLGLVGVGLGVTALRKK